MSKALGITAAHYRDIKPGEQYNVLFPQPQLSDPLLKRDGNVDETVQYMKGIVLKYHSDTAKLAEMIRKKAQNCKPESRTECILKHIFQFVYNHIQYKQDKPGIEQLRRPARTWRDRKEGVDCDCYSIFIGSILHNLNIPFIFRITKYNGKEYYQHVYVVVPFGKREIIIDPVLDKFDYQKPYSEKKDFVMNNLGIPVQFLNGTGLGDTETIREITDLVFPDFEAFEGFGAVEQDTELLNYLKRTAFLVESRPELFLNIHNPVKLKKMLEYAIKYWNTNKRDEALKVLIEQEQKLIDAGIVDLSGLSNEDWELDEGFSGVEDEDPDYIYAYFEEEQIDGLDGKKKKKKKRKKKQKGGFFKKVWNAVKTVHNTAVKVTKKVAKGVAKGAKGALKAVVKYNPVTIAARNGFAFLIRKNFMGMATKIAVGYLSESEASKKGYDLDEWRKLVKVVGKIENMIEKKGLQAKDGKVKKWVLEGARKKPLFRGKKFKQQYNGVGEPYTAGTAVTAAGSFLAAIKKWFKGINFGKLFAKSPEKQAFIEEYEAEHGSKKGWKESYRASKGKGPGLISKMKNAAENAANAEVSESEYPEENGQSFIPMKTRSSEAGNEPEEKPKGFFKKSITWTKENPVKAGLIGLGAGLVVATASSKKFRQFIGIQKKTTPKKRKTTRTKKSLNGPSNHKKVTKVELK